MTRAEIEAAAKANQGEAKLLVILVQLMLDVREAVDQTRKAALEALKLYAADIEQRDSAWTRAKPEPRGKGGKRP